MAKYLMIVVAFVLFSISAFFLSISSVRFSTSERKPYVYPPALLRLVFLNNRVAISQAYLISVVMDVFRLKSFVEIEAKRLILSYEQDPYEGESIFFLASVLPSDRKSARIVLKYLKMSLSVKDYWKAYMYAGMLYYLYFKNYDAAVKYFKLASKFDDCKPYVRSLIMMAYYHAGKLEFARNYLYGILREARNRKEREIILRKIRWIETIIYMNKLIKLFRKKEGRYPKTLAELVERGYIQRLPHEAFGRGFFYDRKTHTVKGVW